MRIAWGITFLFLAGTVYAQDVRVVEVKGSAEMRSAIDQEWTPLKAGDEISDGAWIQTAFKSRVYIKFWTNTVVQIKSVTLVQLKGLSNDGKRMAGRLHLALGAARIRVKPDREEIVDFRVVTTRMTVSIKGTEVLATTRGFEVITGKVLGWSRQMLARILKEGDVVDGPITISKKPEEVSAINGGKFKVETAFQVAAFACVIICSRMDREFLANEVENQGTSGDGGSSQSYTWSGANNSPPIH